MRKFLAVILAILMLGTTCLLASCDVFDSKDSDSIDKLPEFRDTTVLGTDQDSEKPDESDSETETPTETEHVHVFDQELAESGFLKSEATCGQAALYYYSCACGEVGEETFESGETLPHTFDTAWKNDETNHWHAAVCEHTEEVSDLATHVYGSDAVCDVCNYDSTKASLTFKTLQVTDKQVFGKVSNATESFSFADEIIRVGGATYYVTRDEQGTNVLDSFVSLAVGDNVFYVHATLDSEDVLYTITIRRRAIYTVTFNVDGGVEVEPQAVEEDSLATPPATQKFGYVLSGWSYDFAAPITADTTVTAIWEADSRETANAVGGMTAKQLYDRTKEILDENRNFTFNETQTVEMYFAGQYVDTQVDTFVEKVVGDGYSLLMTQNGTTHDYRYVTYGEGDEDNVYYVHQYSQYGTIVKNKANLTPEDFAILAEVDPEESKILGIPESALNSIGFYVEDGLYYIEYMVDGDRYQTMMAFPYDIDGDVSYRLYFDANGEFLNITLKLTAISNTTTMEFCTVALVSDVGTTVIEPPVDAEEYLDVTDAVKEQVEQKKNENNLQPIG